MSLTPFFISLILCGMATASVDSGKSVYNLTSSWKNQDGHAEKLEALRGQLVVIAMTYTSCKGACPLLVEDMKKLEKELPQNEEARFVLVSFDSKHDTPSMLKAFASAHALDQKHWTLLHGDAKQVRDLAAVLGIRYRRDASGEFEHSNLITILDASGAIRFQQNGVGQSTEALAKKLSELKN